MRSNVDAAKLGRKLRLAFVGQREYFRCHYEHDLDGLYDVREFQLLWNPPEGYYEPLLDFNADVNFVFRGELLPVPVVEKLSGTRISFSTEPFPKIISGALAYTLDSLERFKMFVETFDRPYDFIFHYDAASTSFLESQDIRLSNFGPLPIATETYRPLGVPKSRDVLFLGRSTPHLEKFLGLLKRDLDVFHVAHGLPSNLAERNIEREFLPVVCSFKLVLNIHAEPELSWEPRIQQMLACGALVVS